MNIRDMRFAPRLVWPKPAQPDTARDLHLSNRLIDLATKLDKATEALTAASRVILNATDINDPELRQAFRCVRLVTATLDLVSAHWSNISRPEYLRNEAPAVAEDEREEN